MDADIQTLRASFRRIVPRADALSQRFYDLLFERHPEMLPLFDGVRFDEQRKKLVRALALIVRHIEQPAFLKPYLRGLGAIHVAYGVTPELYPALGACLIDALREIAGSTWTVAEDVAWRAAFAMISETMLDGARRSA